MFLRVKTTPNSQRQSVPLVEGIRVGGKVRQRIVRHIGVASDEAELVRLKELGEYIKAREADARQPGLFPPDQVAEEAIEAGRRAAGSPKAEAEPEPEPEPLHVDLGCLLEEKRIVTGIHEAYGRVYRELGLDRLLSRRHRASVQALFHTVMARIANPRSKRESVRRLGRDFGVSLPLEKVYRMMDQLDRRFVDRLRARVAEETGALLGGPLDVLFLDCTTLYFESVAEDDDTGDDALRQFGYSKDGKPHRVQVALALMVARNGLPVGYEVFPGATYEGHTFLPVMDRMREGRPGLEAVCVAGAGMFSERNLAALESRGHGYIVGARLRQLPKALKERVLNTGRYRQAPGEEAGGKVGVFRHKGRRIVVTYSSRRAARDMHLRQEAVKRLLAKLDRSGSSGNPGALLPKGTARFLRQQGEGRWEIDPDRIIEAARWDGLHGVVTNLRGMSLAGLRERYGGLWQVERSFRITRHDLKVRPIFHWTPRRIRAHLAISYMAFACVQHLAWRLRLQKGPGLSPETVRDALLNRQCTIFKHARKPDERYVMPSPASPETQKIYDALGLRLSDVPYALN